MAAPPGRDFAVAAGHRATHLTGPSDKPRLADRRWLLFVCLLAGLTNGAFFLIRPAATLSPDEVEYLELAVSLENSGELRLPSGDVAKRMPLYPAFLAGILRWQGPETFQNDVLLIQTFFAWCATVLIALVAERLADGRAAWVAGSIAAFYSPFRFLQMSFLTETLLILLFTLALLIYVALGIKGRSTLLSWGALALTSLLLGLATLTRANAILLIIPFAVDTVRRAGPAHRRAVRLAMIILPAMACAAAWGSRNAGLPGDYTLSTSGGLNFYLGHNEAYADSPGVGAGTDYDAFDRLRRDQGLGEVEADRRLYGWGWEYIAANPGRSVADCFRKLTVWLSPTVPEHGPLTLVLATGVVVVCGGGLRREGGLSGPRRFYHHLMLAVLVAMLVFWVFKLRETWLPLTTPLFVIPTGLAALIFARPRMNTRGLLIGLFATQLAVAVIFIPLSRLRWAVDCILIIAIGLAVSRLCVWFRHGGSESDGRECADAQAPASGGQS